MHNIVKHRGHVWDQDWSWYYEGRNGWWRFEERNSEELETEFRRGGGQVEIVL